jgi:hypothetical protein
MDRKEYLRKLGMALTYQRSGKKKSYYTGYMSGLRRYYYGDKFVTREDHIKWMNLVNDPGKIKAEQGRGYRDGYEGKDPEASKPKEDI